MQKILAGWWRWALISLDRVAPTQMVGVSASVNLPLHPCTIKSRSSFLAPVHQGGTGKRAVKRLCVCVCVCVLLAIHTEMAQVTLLRTLASSPQSEFTSCHQQGHASSKTLLQQNPPVLNWGCQLVQVVIYNACKMAVVVVVVVVVVAISYQSTFQHVLNIPYLIILYSHRTSS